MKRLFVVILLSTAFLSLAGESASDISARIIKSSFSGVRLKGHVGTDPIPNFTEIKRLQDEATDRSFSEFKDYILSDSVPEKIRIDYAIIILNRTLVHDEAYWQDRLVLGAKLLELQKAEQDAAANP